MILALQTMRQGAQRQHGAARSDGSTKRKIAEETTTLGTNACSHGGQEGVC